MGNIIKQGGINQKDDDTEEKYNKFKITGNKTDRLKLKLIYFRNEAKMGVRLSPEFFIEDVLNDPELGLGNEPITRYYKFGKVLGLDGDSVVRQATLIKDPSFKVAVKAINFTQIGGYYDSILQEILALKQMDHPCIVNLLEIYK